MASHSLKGTFDKSGPQNQWWRHCDVISQSISTKFCIFFVIPKTLTVQNLSKIGQRSGKWRHCDVISKNSSAIFCVWLFLLIPIDVLSFKLIEGQIKELQGVVPNTPPGLRMTKKAQAGRVKGNEQLNLSPRWPKEVFIWNCDIPLFDNINKLVVLSVS